MKGDKEGQFQGARTANPVGPKAKGESRVTKSKGDTVKEGKLHVVLKRTGYVRGTAQ